MSPVACPACETAIQPPPELQGRPGRCPKCRHVFLLPGPCGERPRVFISHATADRDFVESEVVRTLERHGVETWYSPLDISSAAEWESSIHTGLEACDWFLVVMTPRAVASRWVRAEVHWAMDERPEHIVPVLAEECDWKKIHVMMRMIQFVDFRRDREAARKRLISVWGITPTAAALNAVDVPKETGAAPMPVRVPRPVARRREPGEVLTLRFRVPDPHPRPGELVTVKVPIPDPERAPGEPFTLKVPVAEPEIQPGTLMGLRWKPVPPRPQRQG